MAPRTVPIDAGGSPRGVPPGGSGVHTKARKGGTSLLEGASRPRGGMATDPGHSGRAVQAPEPLRQTQWKAGFSPGHHNV